MNCRRIVLALVVFMSAFGATDAQAQFFRNNGISVIGGWKGLGTTFDGLTGQVLWNIEDQVTVGAGYYTAIGYDLWFDIFSAEIGIGSERLVAGREPGPIFSFSATSGIRYQFLSEKIRPFVGAHLQYLQLITVLPNPDVPVNSLTGDSPFWVGLRLGGGCEFFILDEVSLMASLHIAGFTGLNSPPAGGSPTFILPQASGNLAANIYF
jgi:hypothetical protein